MQLLFSNLFDNEEVKIFKYRYARMIFGATCSQFLLNAIVNKHIERHRGINADFVRRIKSKFYVDNLTTGVTNVGEGIEGIRIENSFRQSPV